MADGTDIQRLEDERQAAQTAQEAAAAEAAHKKLELEQAKLVEQQAKVAAAEEASAKADTKPGATAAQNSTLDDVLKSFGLE